MRPSRRTAPRPGRTDSLARAEPDLQLDHRLRAALALDRREADALRAARLPEAVLLRTRERAPGSDAASEEKHRSVPLRGLQAGAAAWAAALAVAALLSGWSLGQVRAAVPDWATSGLLPDPGWLVVDLAGWLLRPLLETAPALADPASPWLVLLAFGLPAIATAAACRHNPPTASLKPGPS